MGLSEPEAGRPGAGGELFDGGQSMLILSVETLAPLEELREVRAGACYRDPENRDADQNRDRCIGW